MNIDANMQKDLIEKLHDVLAFIENLEPKKSCLSCINWQKDGCIAANGITPPVHIIHNGCEKWEIYDSIPY